MIPVIGLDLHLAGSGNPFHPYIGLVIDPADYIPFLGTPIQALDSKGEVVWDCLLDIYGDVLALRGERGFVPFRFQGQYEDEETGLYYNRFRYYSPQSGNYISQDPIRLAGNNPTLYAYTHDSNWWIDPLGLDEILTSGIVYRGGSRTLNNLTPAFPKDATTGLSTFVEKPTSGKYEAIDIAKLQNTGFEAVRDGRNHVSDPQMILIGAS